MFFLLVVLLFNEFAVIYLSIFQLTSFFNRINPIRAFVIHCILLRHTIWKHLKNTGHRQNIICSMLIIHTHARLHTHTRIPAHLHTHTHTYTCIRRTVCSPIRLNQYSSILDSYMTKLS